MKNFILLIVVCTLLGSNLAVGQNGPYKVKVRMGKVYLYTTAYNQNEWKIRLDVDIFDSNNSYVSPAGFQEQWYKKLKYDGVYSEWTFGTDSWTEPDGHRFINDIDPGVAPETG